MTSTNNPPPALARRLGLPLLTLYGLGTMVGAGIFALTGVIAGHAGLHTPLAYTLACAMAGCTALSFAELGARYPRSAGEAVYVREAFGNPWLSIAVGLAVASAGIVSAATMSVAFAGYFGTVVALPPAAMILLVLCGLGAVAARGVVHSAVLAAAATVLSLAALLFVLWCARGALATLPERAVDLYVPVNLDGWKGITAGALLAFYAFLGFEDMVNVAEEVRDVRRVLPRAIIASFLLTALFYAAVSTAAVLVVPPKELAASSAPLALVVERAAGVDPRWISVMGVLSMLNGALVQLVMAARVLYGLARDGGLPAFLGQVHPVTQTPVVATAIAVALATALALWLPLVTLAEITSLLTLVVFALVNAALLALKGRGPAPEGIPVVPRWVPVLGILVSVVFVGYELVR